MTITLQSLSDQLSLKLQGDADCIIDGVGSLTGATSTQLTFFDGDIARNALSDTNAGAVIVREGDIEYCPVNALISSNPRLSYAKVAEMFAYVPKRVPGMHASVVIGDDCNIDNSTSIGANVVIGDEVTIGQDVVIASGCVIEDRVRIGAGCHLHANITLNHSVTLGDRVVIFSGAVIGSDGFGYVKDGPAWYKVPQMGTVIIGDDAEVGANTVIDRGAVGDTVIGKGVILDNLIQIGHNVKIGDYTAVAGCVGIAGSTTIGKHCMIGGGTGIAGHINIADQVMLTGMSMVTNSIKKPGVYSSGTGLQANRDWHKSVVRFQQMDKIAKKVQKLQMQVQQLSEGESDD